MTGVVVTGGVIGWPAMEAALDAMLDRRWYTNHGPAAQSLERRLEQDFAAPHAVIAVNPTVGLLMLLDAAWVAGPVQVAAGVPGWCVQAARWAGLAVAQPQGGSPALAGAGMPAVLLRDDGGLDTLPAGGRVAAIRATVAAGRPVVLQLPCPCDPAGLGCVLTGDDALAARLRNIRSSYGAGTPVRVGRTANGRVSEAQAALALLALDGAEAAPGPG